MAVVAVAQPAPSFRLPSAQGPEIGLEDFRGKQSVLVWFTKGMGCPFCRAQMSQLARAADDVRRLGAEILEVTVSPLPRARLYAQKFALPFPYLCDSDLRVREQWGLENRPRSLAGYAMALIGGMRAPKPANPYGDFAPPLDEMRNVLRDDDMGLFVVDRDGIVRYARAGSYTHEEGTRPLPPNEEILAEVAKLA